VEEHCIKDGKIDLWDSLGCCFLLIQTVAGVQSREVALNGELAIDDRVLGRW